MVEFMFPLKKEMTTLKTKKNTELDWIEQCFTSPANTV